MSEPQNRIGSGPAPSALPKVSGRTPRKPITNELERAIRRLIPTRNRPAITALFDGRAKYCAIHLWRFGYNRAPQWALELLAKKLREALAPDLAMVAELERLADEKRPGYNGASLGAWRVRQCLEKEKAGMSRP